MKPLLYLIVLVSFSGCASTYEDPLGRVVEKQGELDLNENPDPVEKWLDEY